jgi:hypothetical protein
MEIELNGYQKNCFDLKFQTKNPNMLFQINLHLL